MTKKTDTTVKKNNTPKTHHDESAEPVEPEREIRWYHFASAFAVLALFVYALVVFFSRFDLSLVGATATMEYRTSSGCTTDSEKTDYPAKRLGIHEGDMFFIDRKSGAIRRVDNEAEATYRIDSLSEMIKVSARVTVDDEWESRDRYWAHGYRSQVTDESCNEFNQITFVK